MIEVTVALGEDVAVTIETDAGFSPDLLTDVVNRARDAAIAALASVRGE